MIILIRPVVGLVLCFLGKITLALTKDAKIVGGTEVTSGEYPGLVSMQDAWTGQHFCGGSIISDRVILTAGHCFFDDQNRTNPSNSVAYVGSIDWTSGGAVYELLRVIGHENYDPFDPVVRNDIALLQTVKSIIFGATSGAFGLPPAGILIPADTVLTAVGWGTVTYPDTKFPSIAQHLEIGVVTNDYCVERFQVNISTTQLCAGGLEGQGMCGRDSGGPILLNGSVVGIVSWGRPCAQGFPDVFTRVSSFVNWIQQQVDIN